MKLIDIAVNLTDPMFRGIYRGKQRHADDLLQVMSRAKNAGIEKMIFTGVDLESSQEAIALAKQFNQYCTVGIHPLHSDQFNEETLDSLVQLINESPETVVAFGEMGLDFEPSRLESFPNCSIEQQLLTFERQIQSLARLEKKKMPLFLHNRQTNGRFLELLKKYDSLFNLHSFVIHSFDGDIEEAKSYLNAFPNTCFIGINGCSLRTLENIKTLKQIPLNRLLLETDSPWCGIKPSHASFSYYKQWQGRIEEKKMERFEMGKMVKGRNEPCQLRDILSIVSNIKEMSEVEVAQVTFENTLKVFQFEQ